MKFVALVKPFKSVDEAAKVLAQEANLTAAEARMRLASEAPALLVRLAPEAADDLVRRLRQAGLAVLAIDDPAPNDEARTLVRSFVFEPTRAVFTPRFGDALELDWSDVSVVLRASSATRSGSERTEKTTGIDLGTAVITGGLKVTKTVERTVRTSQEDTELSIFVFARDGRGAVLREHALDFSCLGKAMQPARTANMATLAKVLHERAPSAFYDERLMRLGRRPLPFVSGGESRFATSTRVETRASTSNGLDVLIEVMRQAVSQKLLP
jgi:hypothetical protein